MSVRYTVVATLKDLSVQEEYLSWLRESHVKDVIRTGGALSAEVIIRDTPDDANPVIESCYLFPSRKILVAYFDGAAAHLREEMKLKFMDTGKVVSVSRRIGFVSFSFDSADI